MFPTCSIHPNLKLEKHGDKWFAFERLGDGFWAILKVKDQSTHLSRSSTKELLDALAEAKADNKLMIAPILNHL
jgi:hypothetical protein